MSQERPPRLDFAVDKDFAEILTNPFLDIAARFWDEPRYEAFRVCYRSMRRIDDLVDDRKVVGAPLEQGERAGYQAAMSHWMETVRAGQAHDEYTAELLSTLNRFSIPLWPWERLCRAMIYDLDNDGFATFRVFLRYCEGAAISPAAVFVHLCGVEELPDGSYRRPVFDVRKTARALAIFAYLVHILRDFQKDQLRGLNYYADDLIATHALTRADLSRAAETGYVVSGLRSLIRQYCSLADRYRLDARRMLDRLPSDMAPRCRLSLEVIYGLYSLVFERVDPSAGSFSAEELTPTPDDIRDRLQSVIVAFKAANEL
jgi:phytoene/squalene synthetase